METPGSYKYVLPRCFNRISQRCRNAARIMQEAGPIEFQIKELEVWPARGSRSARPANLPPLRLTLRLALSQNSIHHLKRSNLEIELELRESGNDPELRAAVGENIVAIAKREAILQDLRKSLPLAPALKTDEKPTGLSL